MFLRHFLLITMSLKIYIPSLCNPRFIFPRLIFLILYANLSHFFSSCIICFGFQSEFRNPHHNFSAHTQTFHRRKDFYCTICIFHPLNQTLTKKLFIFLNKPYLVWFVSLSIRSPHCRIHQDHTSHTHSLHFRRSGIEEIMWQRSWSGAPLLKSVRSGPLTQGLTSRSTVGVTGHRTATI